ncbi:LuxR family two component transcriptional regulator [Amycolatopsis vancoresmycina DSM 44592]|uniref:LuxR family two component transcriptional regulator n=1 Tax=Amycolatopsis vancoresmycina DSM 44592 TaxID=1292037 RepID=R1HQC7_9PSEU|nr:LuxR family two component transcriptional regulator [Amycolatopsis vancoresmycina DSM 44592]
MAEEGLRDEPTGAMPWAALEALCTLVPCDSLVFKELDVTGEQVPVFQTVAGRERQLEFDGAGDSRANSDFWRLRRNFLPCNYPDRTGDLTSVTLWSDFYTARELRSAPMFADLYGPQGHRFSLLVSLPAPFGRTRRMQIWRDGGPDFGERDRLILQLLRPHLHEVYLRSRQQPAEMPRLTRRELEVVRLVAEGLSNAEIARRLFVSVGTVRKHLEHIFDRTGVRTRTEAVELVLPHLVLDPIPAE